MDDRITADELRTLADMFLYRDTGWRVILQRAANTIDEMDKDIAVFEHTIEGMHKQFEFALAATSSPAAGLREQIEQLPRYDFVQVTRADESVADGIHERPNGTLLGRADALTPLEAEWGTPQCEFCSQPDGDPPAMLEVCPSCWNKANEGSGWMQRALEAEKQLREQGTPAEHEVGGTPPMT